MNDKFEPMSSHDARTLANFFHDTYERLAPSFGYETRADTKVFDHESGNGRLMVSVCGEILAALRRRPHAPDIVFTDRALQASAAHPPEPHFIDGAGYDSADLHAYAERCSADEVARRMAAEAEIAELRAKGAAATAQPAVAEPSDCRVVYRGFRWDGDGQQHFPQLLIEFDPVHANGPCDSKGWKDRDALATAIATAAHQPADPVAWAVFVGGCICVLVHDRTDIERLRIAHGDKLVPLYTHPTGSAQPAREVTHQELVQLLLDATDQRHYRADTIEGYRTLTATFDQLTTAMYEAIDLASKPV